ncbi:MAG: transporter [Crocinitomicaceae bacterium]|nr:transporter [Crocinitomicaceae bacterium]|tara:strand:+ start:2468 stop:3433 length:966 start_codon:yes stop_codon:yes gene_type:complete
MADTHLQDPGLGEKYDGKTTRIINPDGTFNVVREGVGSKINNLYHFLLNVSWTQFVLVLIGGYIVANGLFAVLYLIAGIDGLAGVNDLDTTNDFLIAIFFSFQTFTTLGYGGLSPIATDINIIAGFQAMFGFMSFSIATGLLYGRFSKPSARIKYSKNILLAPYENGFALMFRIVNRRDNLLMDMSAKVLLATSRKVNGMYIRSYDQLNLAINKIDFFPLNWTIVHPIDEGSPLYGKSASEVIKLNPQVVVLIKGFDDSFSQEVHSRYSYTLKEIIFNAKFKPAYKVFEDGSTHININDIDAYTKLEGKVGDILKKESQKV